MDYNNPYYSPYSYQAQPYQTQPYRANPYLQPQMMPAQQPPKTNIIKAYSKDAVGAMGFELNSEMLVCDQSKPFVYLVSTDFANVKTIKAFKLVPMDGDGEESDEKNQSKADFEQIKEDIRQIKERILSVNSEQIDKEKKE